MIILFYKISSMIKDEKQLKTNSSSPLQAVTFSMYFGFYWLLLPFVVISKITFAPVPLLAKNYALLIFLEDEEKHGQTISYLFL